jgi:molybdenum cofactor biosynthesis enzyme
LFTSDGVTQTSGITRAIRLAGAIGFCPSAKVSAHIITIAVKISTTVSVFVAFSSISTLETYSTGAVDVANVSISANIRAGITGSI